MTMVPLQRPFLSRLVLFSLLFACISSQASANERTECRSLQCRNGGVCRKAKHMTVFDGDIKGIAANARNVYCHCPPGFAGPFCEIRYQSCPQPVEDEKKQQTNPTVFCNNGAPCDRDVNHDGQVYFHCECDDSVTDYSTLYARRACQHASTVFCTGQKEHQSLGQAAGSYCRNGGTCKVSPQQQQEQDQQQPNRHEGCNCPDGWGGPHCEELLNESLAEKYHYYDEDEEMDITSYYMTSPSRYSTSGWRMTVLSLCCLIILAMVGGILYIFYDSYRQNSYSRKRRMEKTARIPRHIGVRSRKGKKFEPMEIDNADEVDEDPLG